MTRYQGSAPCSCQFCGSARLNRNYGAGTDFKYEDNHAHCMDCRRKSIPVTTQACWDAIGFISDMGPDMAMKWRPLMDTIRDIQIHRATGFKSDSRETTHAELLALRALWRRDYKAALAILQQWAAEAAYDWAP